MCEGLRIVTFNVFPPAYQLVADWAARHGHRLVLLITPPGRSGDRYGAEHSSLIDVVPAGQDILITNRLRRTAAPVIAALQPDLIVSATFPRRIPAEVTAIPRLGAVNVHPAPLPRGRGPNPVRLIYEGNLIAGAALHRISPEFDAGAILSRREQRLPDAVTPEIIFGAWLEMVAAVFDEGMRRAIAGEPGEPQDERLASYAAPFTDKEHWLTWDEPALTVQRRAAALNLMGPTARAWLDGTAVSVLDVRACPEAAPTAAPGTILDHTGDIVTIRVADSAVRATISPESHRTAP
jgi:methionyl-tRNA formyltransferase